MQSGIHLVRWFAVYTLPRHEKAVSFQLTLKGICNYLPLVCRVHQWSDRRKRVELPLFPSYLFVRIAASPEQRVDVLTVKGVLAFVGSGAWGTPIPDRQIDDVKTLLATQILLDPYPFLKVGERVRIRGGSLNGVEGILAGRNGKRRLVITLETLERSLSMSVEGLEVEAA